MNQTIQWKKSQPGSTEAVQFSDGMLVTAEDLSAAMRYPLSVIQVLLKAYFGCGIVCGLEIRKPGDEATPAAGRDSVAANTPRKLPPREPGFVLTVEKGVALGCDGYPIEVCGPLKLDLTPDPCRRDRRPQEMFIAVRRVTAAEATARPCGCGTAGDESAQQCTRMRDHALVQAFDSEHLPAELCRSVAESPSEPAHPDAASYVCDCLKRCGDCDCCGDPWVLLGTVMVGEQGLGIINLEGRQYVKPVACICGAVGRQTEALPAPERPPVVDRKTVRKNATPEAPAVTS